MKWATNKRLHFELGIIKAVQALSEVRITDVISVLAKGADHCAPSLSPQQAPREAPPAPEPAVEEPAAPAKREKPESSGIASLASAIEAAPEVTEPPPAPEPPPWKSEEKKPEPEPEAPPKPSVDETFYQDPLIKAAVERFQGKVVPG